MAYFKLLALSVLYTLVNGDEQVKYAPTVTINTGKVRGLIENAEGEEVFFYQGIRFGLLEFHSNIFIFINIVFQVMPNVLSHLH